MTSRDFCYWLQGFFEITGVSEPTLAVPLTVSQMNTIKNHLNMVFAHEIDPSMGDSSVQSTLNKLHAPTASTAKVPIPRC